MTAPDPPGISPTPSRFGSWSLVLGGLVSLGFLAYFFSGIDYASLSDAIRSADYAWAFLGVILFLSTYPIRAYRWGLLLPAGKGADFRTRFSATTIGFMASNVFPGRAGEFVRATVLAVRTDVEIGASFASIIVERLFDLIVVLMCLAWVLVALPGTLAGDGTASLQDFAQVGLVFGAVTLAMLLGLFLLKVVPEAVLNLCDRLLFFLDDERRSRIITFIRSIVAGLTVLSGPVHILRVFFLSLVHWSVAVLGIHVTLWAFHVNPPILASVMVFVFTALAVALPQAPGFIGVWQVAAEKALAIVGIELYAAKGFSLVCWSANIVPVTALGFWFLSMEGLNVRSMLESRSRAAPPDS